MVVFGGNKKPSQGWDGPSFDAIVGQEELKQALLVVATDEEIDGLLVQGEKGTAKSTAVRALAELLPSQRAVADCPYGCHPSDAAEQCRECQSRSDPPVTERPVPLVTLPLGATRDRVVGTLSVSDALEGEKSFEQGLLARAHRGLLYVDEVNLLDDHLVDVLLDAAASGVNRVERDGVSVSHPSSFTLIGTMNPEEGELRPQLRDRFALQATVAGCEEIDDRVRIIEQSLGDTASSHDPDARDPAQRLRTARQRLESVELPAEFTERIATICRDSGVDGHRGDIATARAARTIAALNGRRKVVEPDVERAAELALRHRFRSRPFEDAPDPAETISDHFEDDTADSDDQSTDGSEESETENDEQESESDADPAGNDRSDPSDSRSEREEDGSDDNRDGGQPENAPVEATEPGDSDMADEPDPDGRDDGHDPSTDEPKDATPLLPGQERVGIGDGSAPELDLADSFERKNSDSGSRARAKPSTDGSGARVRTRQAKSAESVDAAASVRAATRRGRDDLTERDLRASVQATDTGALVLFVVDASASMRSAMQTAKGTVLELLKDAYTQRDEVGFVRVAGDSADVVLPPTDSVTLAARHLKDLPTGDRTPLPDGLWTAGDVIDRADPSACVVVLVTDGRANVANGSPTRQTRMAARALAERGPEVVVVDAGTSNRSGVTDIVLDATGGERVSLDALSAERLDATVATRGDRR